MERVLLSERPIKAIRTALRYTKESFASDPDVFDVMTEAEHELLSYLSACQRVDKALGQCPKCHEFKLMRSEMPEQDMTFDIVKCIGCGWWG